MPIVGNGKNARKFPYTKKGEAAARKEAKRTGKKLKVRKGPIYGGMTGG